MKTSYYLFLEYLSSKNSFEELHWSKLLWGKDFEYPANESECKAC